MNRWGNLSSLGSTDTRADVGGRPVRKRLDEDRRDELLGGVMAIIAERGFSQVQVAELARRLSAEGMMDPSRKRGLPSFPERIGL